ncbi:serine hydrolase [Glutamicibacter sp. PS]|uniref:serine hydrolase n=1 Tax=Glutamicibacter sp. PS TaxID=3075634 RepID=UPI00284AA571|nr:serine hydrolase [Glutamicibacter sp. PS]MDR4534704.1 serine hydrolase [Glutamicibacter sp. PS]
MRTVGQWVQGKAQLGVKALTIAVLVPLSLAGCTSQGTDPATESPAASSPAASHPTPVAIPQTPAGTKAEKILDILNAPEESTENDWNEELAKSFTDAVSVQQVVELTNRQLRGAGPYTVVGYEGAERTASLRLAGQTPPDLMMHLNLDNAGKVSGLRFVPALDEQRTPLASFDEVSDALEKLPGSVSAYVARTDGSEVFLEQNADESAPLGSMFKLYVLLAVAQEVETARDLSWDDQLILRDKDKSLPSGELQNEADGTRLTVYEAAQKMISISDNTATDMLIDAVGRPAVERAVRDSGHHDPQELHPFLSTKDMLKLAWGDADRLESWAQADADRRRILHEKLQAEPFKVTVEDVGTEPAWDEGAEWFASPKDIARVHNALHELAEPQVARILTENPGIPMDGWRHAAFKGGSDVGVLAGSWLVSDEAGNSYVVVLQQNSKERQEAQDIAEQEQEFFHIAGDIMKLLPKG